MIENYKDKGWDFFRQSLSEIQVGKNVNLFDGEIYKNYENLDRTKFNFTSIPGAIGFFHFSNNMLIVFFGCFTLLFLFSILEILSYFISKGNFFFSALIGQNLAYRIIHFGIFPIETYKLIITILFTMLIFFFLNKIFLSDINKKI